MRARQTVRLQHAPSSGQDMLCVCIIVRSKHGDSGGEEEEGEEGRGGGPIMSNELTFLHAPALQCKVGADY